MQKSRRWIAKTTEAAADTDTTALPWTRGARRAAWIAKRTAAQTAPSKRAARG